MSSNLVLDISAYSQLKKGHPAMIKMLASHKGSITVPVVVVAELMYGFKKGTKQKENTLTLEHFFWRTKR